MNGHGSKRKVIVIVGPTAVGKTDLSLYLAGQLNSEIVSADSRYLYRGMDIGTAKPPREILEKIPHHLINVATPDEIWSLGKFLDEVNEAIEAINRKGKLPILVGGTGQYIRAILKGWNPPAIAPDPLLRSKLENWLKQYNPQEIRKKLAILDPELAQIIDAKNMRRVIRAFEVMYKSGKRYSTLRQAHEPKYEFFVIGLILPREILYRRVDKRIDNMIEAGFIDEVRQLMQNGYTRDLPSFSAIGYREIMDVLDNKMTLEEAITIMRRKTRTLIRRQANWFRADDPQIHWFNATESYAFVLQSIKEWLYSE